MKQRAIKAGNTNLLAPAAERTAQTSMTRIGDADMHDAVPMPRATSDRLIQRMPHMINRDPDALRYACVWCNQVKEPIPWGDVYIRRRCLCALLAQDAETKETLTQRVKDIRLSNLIADVYNWLGPQAEEVGLADMTFANFELHAQITPSQLTAHATCKAFVAHHLRGQHWLENLLLFGEQVGTGKTHLACAVLNTVAAEGKACLFCTVQGFFDALYAAKFDEKQTLLYQAATTPLLVLDDLDKLHIKDGGTYQKDVLFELLDKRYKRRLPTVITTNEERDLDKWFDKATLSRLLERITLLQLIGIDYRLLRAARRATEAQQGQ